VRIKQLAYSSNFLEAEPLAWRAVELSENWRRERQVCRCSQRDGDRLPQTRSDEAESLLKRGLEIHGKADGRNAPQGGLDPRATLGWLYCEEGEGGRQWDHVALTDNIRSEQISRRRGHASARR
jgi:hypothetical protein